jgi:hypothetical protein
MRDQFIDFKGQREKDSHSYHENPEEKSKLTAHDQMDSFYRASCGNIEPQNE